jgi:hypothetical protein
MAKDETNNQTEDLTIPNPDLKGLEKLVGTWKVSGGIKGEITFEWMEGGFFLVQHVELVHNGHQVKGIEIIGHEFKFGEKPSSEIKTRFYSYLDGLTLDYVYEMDGNNLTIWGGEKGSPAYCKGEFSEDGDSFNIEWVYPGGGYKANGVRKRSK